MLSGSEGPSLGGQREAAEQWLKVGKGAPWSPMVFDSKPAAALGIGLFVSLSEPH